MWSGEEKLATERRIGIPHGHPVHHVWFKIRAIVGPHVVRLFFEDREVISHRPATPVPTGHVGLWTENNAVFVARATVSMVAEFPQPPVAPRLR